MITVYSPKKSNRLKYVIDLVFKQILKTEYQIVDDENQLDKVSINYSSKKIPGVYQIIPNDLLFTEELNENEIIHEFNKLDIVRFFLTKDDHGFDVFSACFYIVTRMEEYVDKNRDIHQRYSAKQSILYKLDVLEKPIVNIWCNNLLNKLNDFYNSNILSEAIFNQLDTIDIDNAYAYLHKGFFRTTAALVKSLILFKFNEFSQRIRVLMGKEKDPYDTYDYLFEHQETKQIRSYYFFLLGDYHKMDKNLFFKSEALQKLIIRINDKADIGIHPSYFSFLKLDHIGKELNRLKSIVHEKVVNSRNHYLRFSIPDTYQSLISLGVEKDFTMGYPDALGFRAGMCSPYTFFDLITNEETSLQIIPFAYMDGVLKDQMDLNVKQAIAKIEALRKEVKKVNGCFVGIWHNESLSNQGRWIGWRAVYESSFA